MDASHLWHPGFQLQPQQNVGVLGDPPEERSKSRLSISEGFKEQGLNSQLNPQPPAGPWEAVPASKAEAAGSGPKNTRTISLK